MAFSSLHRVHRALPVVALLALAALTAPTSARAQSLLFTLSGVTFSDGATGAGSFVYNQTTNAINAFNITTSSGNTGLIGVNYLPNSSKAVFFAPALYQFTNGSTNTLNLVLPTAPLSPGTYALSPGTVSPQASLSGSGEFARNSTGASAPRAITTGNLIVTNPAAAPEPGTIALLLVAGVPVAGLVRRRSKH